jgi:hypothetical protein
MRPGEVVVHEVQADGVGEIFGLLREGVGQAGEAPHAHAHREVLARAAKLTPEQRHNIASEAAQRQWAQRPAKIADSMPRALPGFKAVLDLGGVKLPCAVIEGPNGIQRVLTEHGITNAILGSRSGGSKRLKRAVEQGGGFLPLFLAPRQLWPFIQQQFQEGQEGPRNHRARLIGVSAMKRTQTCCMPSPLSLTSLTRRSRSGSAATTRPSSFAAATNSSGYAFR